MRSHLLFIALLLLSVAVSAQTGTVEPFGADLIRCATPVKTPAQLAAYEKWMTDQMALIKRDPAAQRAELEIPVIVHIIHEGEPLGEGNNISMERVMSQFDVLNEDFNGSIHPQGADVDIYFCPVDKAPDGSVLEEPGIHRVNRNSMGFIPSPYSQGYVSETIKAATIWDPYSYMNIWVCNMSGSLLGFAEYPVGTTLTGLSGNATDQDDGVVINTKAFGYAPSELPAPYNLGRTTTHEVGHFLGLHHIWGDSPCGDDFCEDTNPAEDAHYGCPPAPFSCNTVDMYENYMDYTDDRCMSRFTECQKLRMRTALMTGLRRKELLNSNACSPIVFPPVANISANIREGCPGLIVRFSDESTNRPNSWQWKFPGGTPETSTEREPVVTYDATGSFDVELVVANDNGSVTLNLFDYIEVKRGTEISAFYAEDFERGGNGWTVENPDASNSWSLSFDAIGSKAGKVSMMMQHADYEKLGERDRLISPEISLRDRYNISLSFDHAYRQDEEDNQDSLIVKVSTDGGETFPHVIFAAAPNGRGALATNSSLSAPFVPQLDDDWCYGGDVGLTCQTLDMNDFQGFSKVHLMFESYNDNGNNLFIDNVILSGSCLPDKEPDELVFRTYPNPTSDEVTLEFYHETSEEIEISVFNLLGQRLWRDSFFANVGEVTHQLYLGSLAPGTYLVRLSGSTETGVRKIVKTYK